MSTIWTNSVSPLSAGALRSQVRLAALDMLWSISLLTAITIIFVTICALASHRSFGYLFIKLVHVLASMSQLTDVIATALPLCLMALAFSVPYLAGFINLGAEGQVSLAALTATMFALLIASSKIGGAVVIVGSIVVAAITAMLWGSLSVLLKYKFRAHEVIVTFVLNALALSTINLLLMIKRAPWYSKDAQGLQSLGLAPRLLLSAIIEHSRLSWLTISFAAIILAVHVLLWYSSVGLRVRAVGSGLMTARLAGMNDRASVFIAVSIGGVLAGIAGLDEIFRVGRFQAEDFAGWGFEGITIAILGRHKWLGIVLASVYLTILRQFALSAQTYGVSYGWFLVVQAVCIVLYLVADRRKNA